MSKVTIKEAATMLGCSVDTVRRRIKDGTLKGNKVPGAYGHQWVIDTNDIATFQRVVDVVTVKQNIEATELMEQIQTTVLEATREATRQGTKEAMQVYENKLNTIEDRLDLVVELLEQQQLMLMEKPPEKRGFFERFIKR